MTYKLVEMFPRVSGTTYKIDFQWFLFLPNFYDYLWTIKIDISPFLLNFWEKCSQSSQIGLNFEQKIKNILTES